MTRTGIAYARRSTDRQDLSIEAQRSDIAKWAKANDVEVAEWYEEELSGATPMDERPQLLLALAAVTRKRGGLLLILRRDRLARDPMVSGMVDQIVRRKGGSVLCVDGVGNGDEPTDVLLKGIIDLFSQHERLMIGVRTRAALAVKKSRGEKTGGACPYGTRLGPDGVHLIPHPAEAAMVARARELRASGITLRGVASALVAEGYAPRSGGRWHPETVRSILASQVSVGTCRSPMVQERV